ncbi:hypothetical protein Q3G72_010982 [Acer saccharum]|nr:hypothetical protein Q3G72_010982 [Acer saccharum]
MDLEFENVIAAILLNKAVELHRQAEKDSNEDRTELASEDGIAFSYWKIDSYADFTNDVDTKIQNSFAALFRVLLTLTRSRIDDAIGHKQHSIASGYLLL